MYIRTDYEISLCPAIRLAGGRSAENGPNLRQIQVATTSNRLYVIYYEVITTLSRLLSETLVPSDLNPHFYPGGAIMAPDFRLQRVLATEERSGHYVRGSMCALKAKRQARARPAPCVTASRQNSTNKLVKTNGASRMYPATR